MDIVLGMMAFKNLHVVLGSSLLLSFNLFFKVGLMLCHDSIHLCLQGEIEGDIKGEIAIEGDIKGEIEDEDEIEGDMERALP